MSDFVPQFNWQNPHLRATIYPFRRDKLRDFLLYFFEIDLLKEYTGRSENEPEIAREIQQVKGILDREYQQVRMALANRLAAKSAADKWFAQKTTFNARLWYLEAQVEQLEDKRENNLAEQSRLEKRKAWDTRLAVIEAEIAKKQAENRDLCRQIITDNQLLKYMQREPVLVKAATRKIEIRDFLRLKVANEKRRLDGLDLDTLMAQVVERFRANPERYPEWLIYMVIHFSGMRYISSHGSWASPKYLLELLQAENLDDEVGRMTPEQIAAACQRAVTELQQESARTTDPQRRSEIAAQMHLLNDPNADRKPVLQQYLTAKSAREVEGLPDEGEVLKRLVAYKDFMATSGNPIPPWVWSEIVKYTPLRLQTEDANWEAYENDRWKREDSRWREMLAVWENKDITSWRQAHKETLDLIVTRAVCNEIAEHIQHMRGINPAGGLTSKPKWYLNQQALNPGKAFFRHAMNAQDFPVGASILWLEWMAKAPSPWQVAHPITGFTFTPAGVKVIGETAPGKPSKPDPKPGKPAAVVGDGWTYKLVNNAYIRTKKIDIKGALEARRKELQAQGKKENEIKQAINQLQKELGNRPEEIEYLRWRHEATVVGVVAMLDGTYVMTFETGKIGVILRNIGSLAGNPMVYMGYVPPINPFPEDLSTKLGEMLRWDRILPGANLPPRVRPPAEVEEAAASTGDAQPKDEAAPEEPHHEVVAVRLQVKGWQMGLPAKQPPPNANVKQPPINLPRGTRLSISAIHKESVQDVGDGRIHTKSGVLYRVTACTSHPAIVGLMVPEFEVARADGELWMQVKAGAAKVSCHEFTTRDKALKPLFIPVSKPQNLVIQAGIKFRVSPSHKESDKDAGDGIIMGTGNQPHYVIVECPAFPAAVGHYVETTEVQPAEKSV